MSGEKKEEKKQFNSLINEYLGLYYSYLFPHNLFHQWLSYGNVKENYFQNREFSFTLPGDIYFRFQSYDTCQEMRSAINKRKPLKIDIGAVYNIKPKDSKKSKVLTFAPEERELVFDIDMTDYDDVRTCCKGADICPKCWPFMVVAAKILDAFLREDFGFKHLLWVYSGRRGIHCWVADARARKLHGYAREAIANFINIFEGGHFKAKKVEINGNRGVHPSLVRSVQIIDKYFEELMVKNQDFLATKEQVEVITNLCLDPELRDDMRKYMNDPKMKSSADRWKCLWQKSCRFYGNPQLHKVRKYTIWKHRFFLEELKLQLCYPRLDVGVTKGLNHLLKVPYSVHPKTGRVCVPIDFATIDQFDPFSVPTVDQLMSEVDKMKPEELENVQGSSRLAERTALAPSLAVFRRFINGLSESKSKEVESGGLKVKPQNSCTTKSLDF